MLLDIYVHVECIYVVRLIFIVYMVIVTDVYVDLIEVLLYK